MIRPLLSFLVACLLVPLASAQEAPSMGGGMPDPRQMSGKPRPDQAVPAGTITVRVIRGDMGLLASPGTPVHLVATGADGKTTVRTEPVNAQGRAEFKGLATDGSVVYYALTLLDGDRLFSEQVVLPPKIGRAHV